MVAVLELICVFPQFPPQNSGPKTLASEMLVTLLILSLPTSPIGNLDTNYLEGMQRHNVSSNTRNKICLNVKL